MRKYFVLSKRTILSKKNVTQSFGDDNIIVILKSVVDDVERVYTTQYDERSKIAKEFLNYLDEFETKELLKGVIQKNGSILKVVLDSQYKEEKIANNVNLKDMESSHIKILKCCLGLKKELKEDEKVILVSKSKSLRMSADIVGIEAQAFKDELLPEISEQYTGRTEANITSDMLKEFYDNNKISLKSVEQMNKNQTFYPNMFVVMKAGSTKALGRVKGDSIIALVHQNSYPYGIIPKNIGQKFMIEALMMDENVANFVIIKGPAGTAKTFLSFATGLEFVKRRNKFKNNILFSRSPIETGEKIGFLPGDEKKKMDPYLRGVKDNLRQLMSADNEKAENKDKLVERLFERGTINVEAIGFIRGRTICDTFMIIDEAQNLTTTEVKTIITRVGVGTKLILIGDPAQIDRPELSERNNGLSYASERFKGDESCWQITMDDSESVRSELAKRASILL